MIAALRDLCDVVQGKSGDKRVNRSGRWPKRRKDYLRTHHNCAACSRYKKRHMLEVHHITPFHIAPELELKESNLITLCRRCHLLLGHLNNWRHHNPSILWDATTLLESIDYAKELHESIQQG